MKRRYWDLEPAVAAIDSADLTTRMQCFVDAMWPHLHAAGVSWLGFYLRDGDNRLVLGPRRDKPACSPIGLHGACGRAVLTRRPLVVHDVAELGDEYIACDVNDRSEVVIPIFDEKGLCRGVLDLDSHAVGAFDEHDVECLTRLLRLAGLT
jgi:putative methionine-R-sulfoxide reductase with GAF domain